MILKRATKKLEKAGIHIQIKKVLWGYMPYNPKMNKQHSECFKTANEAVRAVFNGFRPN